MMERLQIYAATSAGTSAVLHAGCGKLVCCGQHMELLAELTNGASEAPRAEFKLAAEGRVIVRAYCSKHGFRKAELV